MEEHERRRLAATMMEPHPLEAVAEAIARVRPGLTVYVERRRSGYRWSIAAAGGPYPLLRELALYLDLPHTQIMVPFNTVGGLAIVWPSRLRRTQAWAHIKSGASAEEIAERIRKACRSVTR